MCLLSTPTSSSSSTQHDSPALHRRESGPSQMRPYQDSLTVRRVGSTLTCTSLARVPKGTRIQTSTWAWSRKKKGRMDGVGRMAISPSPASKRPVCRRTSVLVCVHRSFCARSSDFHSFLARKMCGGGRESNPRTDRSPSSSKPSRLLSNWPRAGSRRSEGPGRSEEKKRNGTTYTKTR